MTLCSHISSRISNRHGSLAASFNNFLDAIDGSYCTFDGGDDPSIDATYPDTQPGGYTGMSIYLQAVHLNLKYKSEGPEDCGTVTPAYVISTSYTYNEADLSLFYAKRQCAEYAKLGLMGITFLYSSGDNGVAGGASGHVTCLNPNGKDRSLDVILDGCLITSCQEHKPPMGRYSTPASLEPAHTSHLSVLRW